MICGTFLARALIEFKINVFYVGATLSTKIKGRQRLSRQEERLPMSLGRMGWRGRGRTRGWMAGWAEGGVADAVAVAVATRRHSGGRTHP